MATAKHRAVQPRYGRLTALAASVAVVAIALLASAGGWGGRTAPQAAASVDVPLSSAPRPAALAAPPSAPASASPPASGPASGPASAPAAPDPKALPARSGSGRRIVFDQSAQRIWLVDDGGEVQRTYLGSGSVIDNLHPGSYAVYSRSRWAVGVDDSGVMEYFVRFTKGPQGGAIGFHTIPTKHGVALQKVSQLGTPRSHGCIRQRTTDAIALWDFAPEGTKVVVVA
jgi:lipoprotein-anchoring transpeptidase ErfK/SrfK